MNRKEMLEFLEEMQEICKSHVDCDDCPLDCPLGGEKPVITGGAPCKWEIPEEEE